nr:hypothetical protein [Tanacetum cinerariifolium]
MQTQTSNTLHNAIMEAGGKDRPPMLAPGNYVQWKSKIKRYIDTKPNHELIHYCLKNPPYKFTWADKEVPIFEGSHVIRTKTSTGYENQRIGNVVGAKETVGSTMVQKYGIQCYNCKEFRHVVRECQKPKRVKDAAYHREKMLMCKQEEAGIQLNAEQDDWRDDTDDELEDQELEAHYMYMAQIQEVSSDAVDSGPIFDSEPVQKLVKIVLFIVDSGCSKYMTGNLNFLINFVEKFLGTVKFGNDQIAPILGYGDLVHGAVTIKRSTCYIRDLKGNDLLIGSRGTDLYSITLQDTNSPNPICLMAKETSSQASLWHHRLSHLNFDTINLLSKNDVVIGLPKLKFFKDYLCSSCELGKAKRKSFHTKTTPSSKRRLQLLHMDLCGPMRTHFMRSKDETPKVLIDFLRLVQRGLHAQVRIVRTDKGTEFLKKTLHAYFASEGILHQTSVARIPEQNGVVERQNRTLAEAARTMLSAAKMASGHVSSDPGPQCQTTTLEHDSLSLGLQSTADVPNQRQLLNTTPLNNQTTPDPSCQVLTQAPTVASTDNINQAKTSEEYAHVQDDKFINIFSTPIQDRGETSNRHVDSSNMHTFYQHYPSDHRWMKDHPIKQVIGNPSQTVRTRRQLESDGEMCMFALTVSQTKPKNIKEAMVDSSWIESMQEELHQFDRLDVWELVDRPLCKNVINIKWLWKNK